MSASTRALNVARTVNKGQRCLLLARPGVAKKVWNTLTNPYYSEKSNDKTGVQILYNGGNLTIDGKQILRSTVPEENQDYTVRKYDAESDEYICGHENGTVYHRFESMEAVFENADAYSETLPKDADVPDHLTGVKTPFIASRMFDTGEIPDRDQWDVIEVPPDATDPGDLLIFGDGEPIPFDEWSDQELMREDVLEELSDYRGNGKGTEAVANDD